MLNDKSEGIYLRTYLTRLYSSDEDEGYIEIQGEIVERRKNVCSQKFNCQSTKIPLSVSCYLFRVFM